MLILRVIQHCHCSSCAQHNAPTAAARGGPCACGRSALCSQYYNSSVCCHRHWPMHKPAAMCDGPFLLRTDHPRVVHVRRVQYNKSFVQAPCIVAFVQNILTVTDCCASYHADRYILEPAERAAVHVPLSQYAYFLLSYHFCRAGQGLPCCSLGVTI